MSTRCSALGRKEINQLSQGANGDRRAHHAAPSGLLLGAAGRADSVDSPERLNRRKQPVNFSPVPTSSLSKSSWKTARLNNWKNMPKLMSAGACVWENKFSRMLGSGLKAVERFSRCTDHPSLAVKFNWRKPRQRFAGLS